MHGFRVQVQAQVTGAVATRVVFTESIYYGDYQAWISASNFEGTPTAAELAAFLANYPRPGGFGPIQNVTIIGSTTHLQDYAVNPPDPAMASGFPQTFWELAPPSSIQLSAISVVGDQVRFNVSGGKYRVQYFAEYTGVAVGPRYTEQNPEWPNYPAFP